MYGQIYRVVGPGRETAQIESKTYMDTQTFIIQDKVSITVPTIAIKVLDVQATGKGAFDAYVVINAGGLGHLRGRLDPKLLDGTDSTDRDLDGVTRVLAPVVFRDNDPVPLVSLTRLSPGGGDDSGASSPSPAGPNLDVK